MRFKKFLVISLGCIPSLLLLLNVSSVSATASKVNLIDDEVFDDYNSMSTSQIDDFLNKFPNSCISSSRGFRAIDPTGYNPTNGYLYGGNVTAGRVINDAAKAYEINPQVLLATTQKEEGLVTGADGCTPLRYSAAMGYGCPDNITAHNYSSVNLYSLNGHEVTSVSGTCVNSVQKVGFTQQIIHAAWLLKFDRERAEGRVTWAIIRGNWNNNDDLSTCYSGLMTQGNFQRCPSGPASSYDGLATIDGQSIKLANGATASLFVYTPHFSGNTHFDTIFSSWFGSIFAPNFHATFAGQSGYPTIVQGDSTTTYIRYANTGNRPWYDSVSAPQYKTYQANLATAQPINRSDIFSKGWHSSSRPSITFAHVYDADGVTLAPDQHKVEPGQIAEYDFTFTAPSGLSPGTYQEFFQPVLDGSTMWNMGGLAWSYVKVQPITFKASFYNQSAYPTIARGGTSAAFFKFKNTGNRPWFDDTSAPLYHTCAVHLAATKPINRTDPFSASWSSINRPSKNFAHVYAADGTTLAPDQHIVQPGQIAEYDFSFTVPAGFRLGTYQETFQPVLEGSKWWNMGGVVWLDVTVSP